VSASSLRSYFSSTTDAAPRLQVTARGAHLDILGDTGVVVPVDLGPDDVEVLVDAEGRRHVWLHHGGVTRVLDEVPAVRHADASAPAGAATFTAPMPGTVIAVEIAAGDTVTAGTTLVVVEAMKMEHPVRAPVAGTVTALYVHEGQTVEAGATLVAFEPATDAGGDRPGGQ